MSLHPLERQVAEGDRYLVAYASVHSILEETAPVQRALLDVPAALQASAIPAARLAHSSGGRHKVKRRLFRPAVALATG